MSPLAQTCRTGLGVAGAKTDTVDPPSGGAPARSRQVAGVSGEIHQAFMQPLPALITPAN